MRGWQAFAMATTMLLQSSTQAFAFNFGFVRVPNWMDGYIGGLVLASLAAYLGLVLTKPAGVPVNQLHRVTISPLANVFRFALLISFMALMGMVFAGMGLQRYAER